MDPGLYSLAVLYLTTLCTYVVLAQNEHHGRHAETVVPRFINLSPRNYTVEEDGQALMFCRVENLGKNQILQWNKVKRKGQSIQIGIGLYVFSHDSRVHVGKDEDRENTWYLRIQKARFEDSGTYECRVAVGTNKAITYQVHLTVKDKVETNKKPVVSVEGPQAVDVDSSLVLTCNATGEKGAPHDIEWYKNGFKIDSDFSRGLIIKNYFVERKNLIISKMSIKFAKMEDSGRYTCRTSDGNKYKVSVEVLDVSSSNKKRGAARAQEPNNGQVSHTSTANTSFVIILTLLYGLV